MWSVPAFLPTWFCYWSSTNAILEWASLVSLSSVHFRGFLWGFMLTHSVHFKMITVWNGFQYFFGGLPCIGRIESDWVLRNQNVVRLLRPSVKLRNVCSHLYPLLQWDFQNTKKLQKCATCWAVRPSCTGEAPTWVIDRRSRLTPRTTRNTTVELPVMIKIAMQDLSTPRET